MKKSFVAFALCVVSFASISANAVDLFTLDSSQSGLAQSSNSNLSTAPKTFTAKLNAAALDRETVVFNLPHKQMIGIQKSKVGQIVDQITPYGFKDQKGFAAVNFKNSKLDNLLIFDEEAAEVFRGELQADGSIVFTQVDIDTFICVNFEQNEVTTSLQAADISYYQSLTNLTFSQVTSLQSRPGANKVLYIDYLAGSVSGTGWNAGDGAPTTITYANYSYDGDANTFSLIDLQSMYAGWAETAEDYAPFDVNVTTDLDVFNAAAQINKSKIIATSTNWRGSGGVAYVGGFGIRNDDFYSIGWTFNKGFGSMGMTNAHESGHQMGLSHDGTSSLDYYSGTGNSGPIMGAPFGKDFVHWNEGTYPDANQTQNDVSIIQGKLGLVADDHGDTNGTASLLSSQELIGFIRPAGLAADVDVFRFTLANTNAVDLTVRSLFAQANISGGDNTAGGLNLSAKIELRNSSNNLIQQQLPSSSAAANDFNYSGSLSAGTYYLRIQPQAYSGANFNEYGNGGYYQILNDLDFSTAPDLLVESPAVDDSSLASGQIFQFSASVRNQGNETSNATTLTYYRSDDSTISSADTNVGNDSVASLIENASDAETINLTAPNTPGNYYYGACVSAVSGETNTTNNCSASVLVVVESTVDLIVESPATNDDTLDSGQIFTLSASVKNQGNSSSPATILTYYRSTNSTISNGDSSVGTDAVASLSPNDSGAESINLNAPAIPGAYYYGACVNSVSGEANSSNNCSTGVLVTVAPTIDLVVESPSVNDNSLNSEQSFTFSSTVKNQGNSNSPPATLTYYRSDNNIISNSDVNVGTDPVASLAANASGNENITLTAPASAGDYYYGACVSSVSGETNSNNNCSSAVLITVASTVDLIVESPDVDNTSVGVEQLFNFSASVKNQGNVSSASTTLIYYRSTDSTITTSDTNVGSDLVAALASNASSPESIDLSAPSIPGNYFYGACVNTVNDESNIANNCSASVLVSVVSVVEPDAYEPNNDFTTATEISGGETQSHSIHEAGDQDWLTFTLSSPAQNLVIETGGASGDDTQVRLYDSNLTELAFSDDADDTRHSKVVLGASQPADTYYILVNDFDNDDTIESYTISVSFDSDEAPDESICLPIKSVNGRLAIICL